MFCCCFLKRTTRELSPDHELYRSSYFEFDLRQIPVKVRFITCCVFCFVKNQIIFPSRSEFFWNVFFLHWTETVMCSLSTCGLCWPGFAFDEFWSAAGGCLPAIAYLSIVFLSYFNPTMLYYYETKMQIHSATSFNAV